MCIMNESELACLCVRVRYYTEDATSTERVLLEGLYDLAALGDFSDADQMAAIDFIHSCVARGRHTYVSLSLSDERKNERTCSL